MGERVLDLLIDRGCARLRDEMDDDLGIDGRLEQRAILDQRVAQDAGIRDVAVVDERQVALVVADEERLGVDEARPAGGATAAPGATNADRNQSPGVTAR